MHKWISGTVCAAAVLAVSVAAAQTYPPTPENQPTTKSAPPRTGGQTDTTRRGTTARTPATRSSSSARTPQQVTMTGCLIRGTGTQSTSWVLSNATTTQGTVNEATVGTSRSGSPSNEGTTAGNRNGTSDIGVSGSTSTAIGTSGTKNPTASIDTEAHGGGTAGATDRNGSTVGAGATAAVTGESPNAASADDESGRKDNRSYKADQPPPNNEASTSAGATAAYQLTGVRNPTQYMNKRVEVVGTRSDAASSGNRMLSVSSIRVLGNTCQ